MALPNEKKSSCAKCKTAGGIATCDGCKKSFCTSHFNEHRQDLSLEMDNIGQCYDILRRDISEKSEAHPLLSRINAWEEESIAKIKKAAETARTDLYKSIDEMRLELQSSLDGVGLDIRSQRESTGFTEMDFKRWTEKLDELRQTFESPCDIKIENEYQDDATINLIRIYHQKDVPEFCPSASVDEIQSCPPVGKRNFFLEEKFDSKTDAKLTNNSLIATCSPRYGAPGAFIYGSNSYSDGIYDISFRIEKKGLSRLFFGICSASKKRVEAISCGIENSVYGWWDINSEVLNGTRHEGGTEQIISTDDKIVLTLDCTHNQIQLYHIRLNRQSEVSVDLNKCPFPWKIIVKLTANNDCVRII